MTIRLFSSEDVGAPALGQTAGDFITILRACLVDGYGTRTAQGWSMPYSNLPEQAAFQTVGGNDVLRVNNENYQYAHLTAYASMSDIDTGVEPYPDNAADLAVNQFWRTGIRGSSNTFYGKWWVISDDEWFYFYAPHDTATPSDPMGFFFGQYDCIEPTFTANYVLTGYSATETTVSTSSVENGLFAEADLWCRRDYRNIAGFRLDARRDFEAVNYQYPSRLTGSIAWERVKIRSDFAPYDYYGTFPEYYRAMTTSDYDLSPMGALITINGDNYLQMTQSTNVIAVKYDVAVG